MEIITIHPRRISLLTQERQNIGSIIDFGFVCV